MYVPVECKNYTDDLENPEFDQLAGRLGGGKGMIGIILCRDLIDGDKARKRCIDEYVDNKKIIITFTDTEIIELLKSFLVEGQIKLNQVLHEKTKSIVLRN